MFATFHFFTQHMKTFYIFSVKIFVWGLAVQYLLTTVDGTVCAAFSGSEKPQRPKPDKEVLYVNCSSRVAPSINMLPHSNISNNQTKEGGDSKFESHFTGHTEKNPKKTSVFVNLFQCIHS